MRAEILKEKLNNGVGVVRKSIGKTTNLPILEGVKISFQKNFLCLTSTNLEIATQWWVLADIEDEGDIVVPAKILSNVISSTKENKIDLEVEKNNLTIKDEKNKTVIQGLEKEDFPVIPEVEKNEKKKVLIKSEKIKEGLSKVVNCVASSNIRPEISGVLMKFTKKELVLVATDSYRLTKKNISLDK